ncbi:MAG: prepilin-type N-terminal cleavage/methylation domain-containing protein [Acidobacteria bacterium]|nr:prepilin-type N-terminal cleavage/methylation domain-containing protein [Acidobacteriota bacterium]
MPNGARDAHSVSACWNRTSFLVSVRGALRHRFSKNFRGKKHFLGAGFTLIELMIVITIILILLSIAAPMYRTSIVRSKEAVLRDDLFTLRSLIDQYTLDKQEAPQSLEDLSSQGYIREIPVDPFTGSNQTWVTVYESDVLMIPGQTMSGIVDVHSGSNLRSLSGELYSSW